MLIIRSEMFDINIPNEISVIIKHIYYLYNDVYKTLNSDKRHKYIVFSIFY